MVQVCGNGAAQVAMPVGRIAELIWGLIRCNAGGPASPMRLSIDLPRPLLRFIASGAQVAPAFSARCGHLRGPNRPLPSIFLAINSSPKGEIPRHVKKLGNSAREMLIAAWNLWKQNPARHRCHPTIFDPTSRGIGLSVEIMVTCHFPSLSLSLSLSLPLF